MRLLQISNDGDLSLVEYFGNDIPPYAILSHTWGADEEEISFKDVKKNRARSKPSGYRKVRFCGEVARRNDIFFFWVDTCCIKQESSQEVGEAINSMYRWYHDAVICYVYLTDVTVGTATYENTSSQPEWVSAFRNSRWFTRGWTLQELLAPVSIRFYSQDGYRLGDRMTLLPQIQWITGIPEAALRGSSLSDFAVEERISWARKRITKREEDAAYSLLGIFSIHMPLIYGEGRRNALKRLQREIVIASRDEPLSPLPSLSTTVSSSATTPQLRGDSILVTPGPNTYTVTRGASTGQAFPRVSALHAVSDLQFAFRIDEIRSELIEGMGPAHKSIRVNGGISGKWWMCSSSIYQMAELPAAFTLYDRTSIYCSSGTYHVAQGDAACPPIGEDSEWHGLNFRHNDDDFSTSLDLHGIHPTLRCRQASSMWPWVLLPEAYHGPVDTSQRYGGLRGSLSIFLALLALSVKPDELEVVMPKFRNNGQWRLPTYQNGRIENRGVVVYVFCGVEPGSTSEDLKVCESGAYGNYFD